MTTFQETRARETALSIYRHMFERLAPFKRIRKLERVTGLPKTISGKIRRVQHRRLEHDAEVKSCGDVNRE